MKRNLTLVFVFIGLVLFAKTWNYEMQTIAIPVGTSESEVFVEKAIMEDMLDIGPTEFKIDENGNIYILDQKQIKKFNENGNYLKTTKQADLIIHSFVIHQNMIWAICGDHLNQVFLRKFSNECDLINTHQIENRKSSLEINQFGNVGLRLSYDSFLEFSPDNDKLEMKETKFLKDVIFDFSAYQNKQDIIFLENNERLELKALWPNALGFHFSGFDAEGNFYFELFTAEHDSEIGIISNEGDVYETNIELPNYNKFGLDFGHGIDCFISQNGNVYQMIPMTDKIEIRKWIRMD